MNLVTTLTAMVAAGGIAGSGYFLEDRYANKQQLAQLVGGNSQQIAIIRIELAKQSKNKALLSRLCTDFIQVHKWQPSACKQ